MLVLIDLKIMVLFMSTNMLVFLKQILKTFVKKKDILKIKSQTMIHYQTIDNIIKVPKVLLDGGIISEGIKLIEIYGFFFQMLGKEGFKYEKFAIPNTSGLKLP